MTAPDDPFKKTGDAHGPPGGSPYDPPAGQPVPREGWGGQPGAGGYGQPPGPGWDGPPPASRSNGLAIGALVVGVLALLSSITVLGGIVLGLVAIVLGAVALRRARRGAGGGVMAGIGLGLGAVGLLIGIGIVALGFSFLNSGAGQDLQSCVDAAQDQAEVDQCATQFEEDFLNQ